jgi:hypothetical protein
MRRPMETSMQDTTTDDVDLQASGGAVAPTRRYQSGRLNSRNWEHVALRADDVMLSAAHPSAALWMRDIVVRLLRNRIQGGFVPPAVDAADADLFTIRTQLRLQRNRRAMVSYLPFDGLPFRDDLQYVAVAQDARDVFLAEWEGRNPGQAADVHAAWRRWASANSLSWEHGGTELVSPYLHTQSWWTMRRRPNVLIVHLADLINDTTTEIAAVAEHLEITIGPVATRIIASETTRAAHHRPRHENPLCTGGWRTRFDHDDLLRHEAAKKQTLGPDCAAYLDHGRHALW